MKKLLLAFVTGGMLLTAAACGSDNNTDSNNSGKQVSASAGEKIYKQKCMSCHGEQLEGVVGPALKNVGAKYSEKDIENIIHEGRGQMPPGVAEGNDAKSVAKWLAAKK